MHTTHIEIIPSILFKNPRKPGKPGSKKIISIDNLAGYRNLEYIILQIPGIENFDLFDSK